MMNYVENAVPRQVACPDGLAEFYEKLHHADDERLHAMGVSAACTRSHGNRNACPLRERLDQNRGVRAGLSAEAASSK